MLSVSLACIYLSSSLIATCLVLGICRPRHARHDFLGLCMISLSSQPGELLRVRTNSAAARDLRLPRCPGGVYLTRSSDSISVLQCILLIFWYAAHDTDNDWHKSHKYTSYTASRLSGLHLLATARPRERELEGLVSGCSAMLLNHAPCCPQPCVPRTPCTATLPSLLLNRPAKA